MKSTIKNYGNGWQAGYTNDDFIRNEVTYYKDFVCGSKYGNCHCRMFFKNRVVTIVLTNNYKVYKTYSIECFEFEETMLFLLTDLFKYLKDYENNIHTATS